MNALIGSNKAPQPFIRVFTVPPGMPWDQARAARLEAVHTSPVPIRDITLVIRRLTHWSFSAPGRFAAIYVRPSEGRDTLNVYVEGQSLRVDLKGASRSIKGWQGWAVRGVLTAIILSGMCVLSVRSLQQRQETEARLTTVEARMARQMREFRRVEQNFEVDRALKAAGLQDRTAGAALSALEEFSRAKAPEARIDAFYWHDGTWSVDVRGDGAPTTQALPGLERGAEPVRRDVWRWANQP